MKKRILKRKAQFYAFAGIILIFSVFLIVSSRPSIVITDFQEYQSYLDNYLYEGRNVMNNAILNNYNITTVLVNYTKYFIEYTNKKDLSMSLGAFYSKDNKIYIVNYLKDSLLINTTIITANGTAEMQYTDTLEVDYRNQTYYFYFKEPYGTELKALLVKDNE